MRIHSIIRVVAMFWLASNAMPASMAATIGLKDGALLDPVPDLTLNSANIDYSYSAFDVCYANENAGVTGECGTALGQETNPPNDDFTFDYANLVQSAGGELTVVGSLLSLEPTGGVLWFIEDAAFSLTANFDVAGGITGAQLDVAGNVVQGGGEDSGNDFQSGTLAFSTSLFDFGFSGDGVAGSFEFIFDAAAGDMTTFTGIDSLAVLVSGTNFLALSGFSNGANGWDPSAANDPAIFTQSFSSGGGADVWTVPVPAAGWLLFSGLISLSVIRLRVS